MNAKDIALAALFAALTATLGLSPVIPLPLIAVTFSLQTLGMLLAGGVIGAKRASIAMGLVIVLVAIGLPVLTGGQGGLGKLVGPTAGFIWSWPLGAAVVGLLVARWWTRLTLVRAGLAALAGSAAIYPLGHTWLCVATGIPARTAWWSWLVYTPGDLLKSVAAAVVIVTVKKAYPLITPRSTPTSADQADPR